MIGAEKIQKNLQLDLFEVSGCVPIKHIEKYQSRYETETPQSAIVILILFAGFISSYHQ